MALLSELPGLLSVGLFVHSTFSLGLFSRRSGLVDPMLLPALAKGETRVAEECASGVRPPSLRCVAPGVGAPDKESDGDNCEDHDRFVVDAWLCGIQAEDAGG